MISMSGKDKVSITKTLVRKTVKKSKSSLGTKTVDFLRLWNELKHDILEIISDPFNAKSINEWETLYSIVYRLCTCPCVNVPQISANLNETDQYEIQQQQQHQYNPQNHSQTLYYLLRDTLYQFTKTKAAQMKSSNLSATALLTMFSNSWECYSFGIDVIHKLFYYMNRDWISNTINQDRNLRKFTNEIYTIRELGIIIWRDVLFEEVKSELIEVTMQMVEKDRTQGGSNPVAPYSHSISTFLNCMIEVGLEEKEMTWFYEKEFEKAFLENTFKFYEIETKKLLDRCSLEEFLILMEERLNEEERRFLRYLNPISKKKLMATCIEVIVDSRHDRLLSEIDSWILNDSFSNIRRLYKLMSKSKEGLSKLKNAFIDKIVMDGNNYFIQNASKISKSSTLFIHSIVKLFDKYWNILKRCGMDESFTCGLKTGIGSLLNNNKIFINAPQKSAELLAYYCHHILRPASELSKLLVQQYGDDKLNEILSTLIILYELLAEADMFFQIYTLLLARRLIYSSFHQSNELTMLSKLKQVCSYGKVFKLEKMFVDIDLSEDINKRFRESQYHKSVEFDETRTISKGSSGSSVSEKHNEESKYSFSILRYNSWPFYYDGVPRMKVTPDIANAMQSFEKYWKSLENGRKLMWMYAISKGIVRTNYSLPHDKFYDLHVTGNQLTVLLQYNDQDCHIINFRQLLFLTNMTAQDLTFVLQGLVKSGILCLNKPEGLSTTIRQEENEVQVSLQLSIQESETYNANDEFHLNMKFECKQRKIALYTYSTQRMTTYESNLALEQVKRDRQYTIQSAIVRIMKTRKVLSHNELVSEVSQQVKTFSARTQDIKHNLELLIEKEYIERDEKNPTIYRYCA